MTQGYGSVLHFEFGEPSLKVYEPRLFKGEMRRLAYVHGHAGVRIDCCHWRILKGPEQVAWSEDERDVIAQATTYLNGQALAEVTLNGAEARACFRFDLGGSLETWPYGDDDTELQWTIHYGPDSFLYRADGRYWTGQGNDPLDEVEWLAIANSSPAS